MDQEEKTLSAGSADSGYSSVYSGESYETYTRKLLEDLVLGLDRLELSGGQAQEQGVVFSRYTNSLLGAIARKTEVDVTKVPFCKSMDSLIREQKVWPTTTAPENEGSFLLLVARTCSNCKIIQGLIERIAREESKRPQDFIKNYIDQGGYNILHCLIDIIIKKADRGCLCTEDWKAYHYCNTLNAELKLQKNTLSQTPLELLSEATGLTEKGEVYSINPALLTRPTNSG